MNSKANKKEILLKQCTPIAVLKARNLESKNSIPYLTIPCEVISIFSYPFRVGRESRVRMIDDQFILLGRTNTLNNIPTNDVYLIDRGEFFQISREHFQIEKHSDTYYLIDKGSHCGMYLNDKRLYGEGTLVSEKLYDGDIIKIGTMESQYIFEFIILDEV